MKRRATARDDSALTHGEEEKWIKNAHTTSTYHKRAPDARSLVSPRPRRRRVPTEREPTHTSTKKYTAIGSPHLLEAARSAAGPAPASSPSIAIIHPCIAQTPRCVTSSPDTTSRGPAPVPCAVADPSSGQPSISHRDLRSSGSAQGATPYDSNNIGNLPKRRVYLSALGSQGAAKRAAAALYSSSSSSSPRAPATSSSPVRLSAPSANPLLGAALVGAFTGQT